MDDTTIHAMQTTLKSVKTRAIRALEELNQEKYQNSLLILMAMILDLSNVAYDLNRHILYYKLKE